MRNDIGEAYRRVMRKAWLPANGNTLRDQGSRLRPLTQHTASMYIKAMIREWSKLGYNLPKAERYLPTLEFVEIERQWFHYTRRSWRNSIVLFNWHDLNHEWSHWMFYRYSGKVRRKANGLQHHCDRHLEWERTGAEWICKRMIQPKPFKLEG